MAFSSGTADVGPDPVALCPVGSAGVRVRNEGDSVVYLGGPDVDDGGYRLEPGQSEQISGSDPKESVVVPAPPDDLIPELLYARTAPDASPVKVSWIGSGGRQYG